MSEDVITRACLVLAVDRDGKEVFAIERDGRVKVRGVDAGPLDAETAERIANALSKPRPRAEWHEDHGDVLWWMFPIAEPPYVGSPLEEDFPDEFTHWTPLVVPADLP